MMDPATQSTTDIPATLEAAERDVIDAPSDTPKPRRYERSVSPENLDHDAVKVVRRLRRYGHEAYLVGGSVRDLLLGKKPKDFDVATSARPNDVRAVFRNCRIIGRRFRLAHVLFGGGKIIEVATFRRDPQDVDGGDNGVNGGRRGEDHDLLIRHDNVFGEPHEDALRRDFSINALFYDTEEKAVIDYVGGMQDLERRLVRTIGSPDVRFREDPIRMLRAIKFSARLDLGIDPDAYDAIVLLRSELKRAARPRLLEELFRLLRGGAAHRSYWLLWETGCLAELLPPVAIHLDDATPDAKRLWGRLEAIDALRRADALPSDAVLLAAVLLGPLEEAIHERLDTETFEEFMGEVVDVLAIPRRIKERIRNIVACQARLRSGRMGSLPRRQYFEDATALFAIDCHARGERVPEWIEDDDVTDETSAPRKRRRRRRRRRS